MTKLLDFQVESIAQREHIHVEDFLTVLAHVEIPLRLGAAGIDCIVNMTRPSIVGEQPVWFLFPIQKFKARLEGLLPSLPHLQYPISVDAAAAFIHAYLLHPDRLRFMPVLLQDCNLQQDVELRRTYIRQLRAKLEMDNDFRLFRNPHEPLGQNSQDWYLDTGLAEKILRKKRLLDEFNDVLLKHRQGIRRIDATKGLATSKIENGFPGIPSALLESGKIDTYVDLLLHQIRSQIAITAAADHLAPTCPPKMHANYLKVRLPGEGTTLDDGSSGTFGPAMTPRPPDLDDATLLAKQPEASILKQRATRRAKAIEMLNSGAELINAEAVAVLLGVQVTTVYNRRDRSHKSYDPDFPSPVESIGGMKWIRKEVKAYIENPKARM